MPQITDIQKDLARIGLLLSQPDSPGDRRLPHWRRELELLEVLAQSLDRIDPDRREPSWLSLLAERTKTLGSMVVSGRHPPRAQEKKPRKPPSKQPTLIESVLSYYPGFLEKERLAAPEPAPPLPVLAVREELVAKIQQHDVLLLTGETGSGKSLLSPLFALEAGLGRRGRIVQTQPRRIAARQIALRLAQMTGTQPGAPFGCHTRVDKSFGRETVVKVATDGILLQEMRGDPLLSRYDLVILDEAHERSIQIDLLLGLLRRIREQREGLKLIITSATLEKERFAEFWQLDSSQVLEVPGRLYPVTQEYRDPDEEPDSPQTDDLAARIGQEISELCASGAPGDVLVFLPRYKEIAETTRELRQLKLPNVALLTMHGRQDPEENARCFRPFPQRKVVLATNIAETSITLPGIRTVIDSGLVNQKQFDPKTGITSLRPRPISRASADQRSGRAGRLAEGTSIRLWPEALHDQRPAFTEPEIRRSDLSALVLRMSDLDITDIPRFPFITRPASQQLSEARRTLIELGALERGGPITEVGKRMAALPLEPRVGRMVLAAVEHHCLDEVLTIAALLSVSRSLFRQPAPDHPQAEATRNRIKQIQRKLADGGSDFDALRTLVDTYRSKRWKERKAYCEKHLGSMVALEEVLTVRGDLVEALRGTGHLMKSRKTGRQKQHEAIGKALVSGLVGNVAVRISRFAYAGPGDTEVYIHPSSVLFETEPKPDLIVAGSIEQGEHRTFARHCMALEVSWLQQVAPHLMGYMHRNKTYDEPSGRVMAEEEVYFRQLTVSQGRQVDLFKRDEKQARRILIAEGLLADKLGLGLDFHRHNEAVVEEVRLLADRLGNPELVADEATLVAFYADRLSGCQNKQDVRRRVKGDPTRLLGMGLADFLGPAELKRAEELYPIEVQLGGHRCAVEYVYNPWNKRRTATISVPQTALRAIRPSDIEKAIPGLLEEHAAPRIEVYDAKGQVLCNEAGFDAVTSALRVVDLDQAWAEAREVLETTPTDQIGRVPGLLEGLCQQIEVCPGVDATLGLELDARGWWHKLYSRPEEALNRSREALAGFVRLKIALRPQIKRGLAPKVSDKLSQRFFEMTGHTSLADGLRQTLEWMACGGYLDVEEFRAGLTLERIGRETDRALTLAKELPGRIEKTLDRLAKIGRDPASTTKADQALQILRTLQEQPPPVLSELLESL